MRASVMTTESEQWVSETAEDMQYDLLVYSYSYNE